MDERQPVRTGDAMSTSNMPVESAETETLVVVSKVKKFIRENSGFNTSQDFIETLTRRVVEECRKGIESAKNSGRKTVMGRDLA